MESKEVTTGKSSVLECMASGSPKPALLWLKDGQPIEVTERHFFAAEDQLLIIVDTALSDAGMYTCKMKNELGETIGMMQLKVKPATPSAVVNVDEMTGIVIITVVCCAVGTSIIWVVIIYQTKKGRGCTNYVMSGGSSGNDSSSTAIIGQFPVYGVPEQNVDAPKIAGIHETQALLSVHGKYPHQMVIVPPTRIENITAAGNAAALMNGDCIYNYDDLSCKDSGNGDSAKRSQNDDSSHNLNSENGISDVCCIELDRTSQTVSYKMSPVTTLCDEVNELIDDELTGSSISLSSNHHIDQSPRKHQHHDVEVNIKTNKLNDLLMEQQHSNHNYLLHNNRSSSSSNLNSSCNSNSNDCGRNYNNLVTSSSSSKNMNRV